MRWTKEVLKAQKAIGHDRIEDIVAMGAKREDIYTELAYKLRLKGRDRVRAHFGKMRSQKEVERAIAALEEIRMRVAPILNKKKKNITIPTNTPKPNPKKLPTKRLTWKEYKDAINDLNKIRKLHPIIRWLYLKYKKYF